MVIAESTVQFILGWEIMGLCSFLLIGHWWEDYANARAALKAFFTVRVGDIGLLVGMSILFFGANAWARENLGSDGFSIFAISGWALSGDASQTVLLWGAVALFIAAIGKSGQFPLHTWLPDAMAGPTPVSALLHSSTMVVAGVYLVARLYPVFFEGFQIGDSNVNLIALIGGITIVIAAVLAFVQVDIKRVLAYSTVSQLGYMMMGLGVGAWLPAVFHIFTHAFFKACLFLGAGLGQPLGLAPLLRHEEGHGRAVAQDADHLRHVRHLDPGPGRAAATGRLLLQGRDHRQRGRQRLPRLPDHRSDGRVPHRRLHDPLRLPHLPGQAQGSVGRSGAHGDEEHELDDDRVLVDAGVVPASVGSHELVDTPAEGALAEGEAPQGPGYDDDHGRGPRPRRGSRRSPWAARVELAHHRAAGGPGRRGAGGRLPAGARPSTSRSSRSGWSPPGVPSCTSRARPSRPVRSWRSPPPRARDRGEAAEGEAARERRGRSRDLCRGGARRIRLLRARAQPRRVRLVEGRRSRSCSSWPASP